MVKWMKGTAGGSLAAVVIFSGIYLKTGNGVCFSLAITFGTISYHLFMRFAVGLLFHKIMNNHADYTRPWFGPKPFENELYRKLRVKSWKGKMPTYEPEVFSLKKHSLEEIAQAMCQSEIVHEVIVILSFLPLIEVLWFDSFFVFLSTSVASACFDMMFVIMQRYNRQRILNMIQRRERK